MFACNELDLEEVNVYGFDYDYTLADYKESLDYLLYNLGRDTLVQKYKVILTHSIYFIISTNIFNTYLIQSTVSSGNIETGIQTGIRRSGTPL